MWEYLMGFLQSKSGCLPLGSLICTVLENNGLLISYVEDVPLLEDDIIWSTSIGLEDVKKMKFMFDASEVPSELLGGKDNPALQLLVNRLANPQGLLQIGRASCRERV